MSAVHQLTEVMSLRLGELHKGVLEDAVDSPNSPRHARCIERIGACVMTRSVDRYCKEPATNKRQHNDNNDDKMFFSAQRTTTSLIVNPPVVKVTGQPLLQGCGTCDSFLLESKKFPWYSRLNTTKGSDQRELSGSCLISQLLKGALREPSGCGVHGHAC